MARRLSRRDMLKSAALSTAGIMVAACGASSPTPPASTASAVETPPPTLKPTTALVEVSVATWYWPEGGDPVVNQFNSSQDKINVTANVIPFDAYREKLLTLMAADQTPDLAQLDGYWMIEFFSQGLLLSLEPYLAADTVLKKDNYLPGALAPKFQVFDGEVFGIPSGDSPKVIWYNRKAFADAGLKDPLESEAEGKWNWDTFLEACRALAEGEGAERHYAYSTWMERGDTDDVMRSFGGGWTDLEVTKVLARQPESITGLQLLLDLYLKENAAPLAETVDALGGGTEMFLANRVAMYMSGVWEIIWLKDAEDIDWDVAPLPSGPAGRFMFHKPNSEVLPKQSAHRDEAWAVMRYMFSPEVEQENMRNKTGQMPFQTGSVDTFLKEGGIPNAQLFIDALEKGWGYAMPVNARGAELDQVVKDALGIALSEDKDAAWVVDEAAPKLEKLVG